MCDSYATPAERAAPESWTIWTYAGLYGSMLLLVLIICAVVSGYDRPSSSDFPIGDLFTSMRSEETALGGREAGKTAAKLRFEEIFAGIQPGITKQK